MLYAHSSTDIFAGQSLSLSSLLVVTFFSSSIIDSVETLTQKCVRTTPCSCRFADGGILDLSRLDTPTRVPKFDAVRGLDGNDYYYDPCSDFRLEGVEKCRRAAICVYYRATKQYADLGSAEAADFGADERGRVMIVYKRVTEEAILTTKVHLICSPKSSRAELLPFGSTNNRTEYNMTLTSKCACADGCNVPPGLSTGSVLLIIFAVGVVVYLGVGMAYNRSLGARGCYAIPQYTFWADFPSLVRDGYWFFLSPCIGDMVEYRHYERL